MIDSDVVVGTKIRLIRSFGGGSYPGATIAEIKAGETAEIIAVMRTGFEPVAEEPCFNVRFDNHLETLDDWGNTFLIGFDDSQYGWDSIMDDWEVVRGFY